MKKITEKIFTETSFQGCNPSVVVTKEGLVQIDSPYVPTEALKWRELKNLGEMKYIINTENHGDHVFGNF